MREDRDTHEFDNVASVGVFLDAEQDLRWGVQLRGVIYECHSRVP